MKRSVPGALVVLSMTSLALGQVPAGPEFRVSTYMTSNQSVPAVALDATGAFTVVWRSQDQDGSGVGVFGQRFSETASPLGDEFQVNTYTSFFQGQPAVAAAPDGRFLVVWEGAGADGDATGIGAQRFDAGGQRIGGEFHVNEFTTSYQQLPAASSDGRGRFVVGWHGVSQDPPFEIRGRRLDASGAMLGGEFQVNTYTTDSQAAASVAAAPDGRFVVAWASFRQDGSSFGVFAQRFDAAGVPLGGEFQVNTYTTLTQSFPTVALAANGTFVVAWTGDDPDGSYSGVFAQRFDAAGARLGAEFRVDGETSGLADEPSAAAAADGSFVITWTGVYGPGDPNIGAFGRRFTAQGSPRGAEFRINTYTTDFQSAPRIASDPHGNFVVAWQSFFQDGSGYGVFAQRFGGLRPAALAVDGPGNRVWEPGETVMVAPSWRNSNGAAQTFGAALSALTGPPGATYAITDAAASYGTVPDGATSPCSDCYGVSVTDPPQRPALHWDATATERVLPDVLGQQQQWVLHLGHSFSDVPDASPFYRFVETLLHRSVTAGCGADRYCPGDGTTRAQMAVFVLVAKEGAGYAPPPCGNPMFADVPASDPFCRWIEELARRGVVSGCGGGNYCPAATVTREQMSVFVLRTLDPALDPPACAAPNVFDDVPETSPFCRWIEELARRGVVTGCAAGLYCPGAPVTREQMAVFIAAGFSLALYGP